VIVFKTVFEVTTSFSQAPGSNRVHLLCKICRKPCEGRIIFDRVLWPFCQLTVSNTVLEGHTCGELRKTYYLAIFSAIFLKIFPPCFWFKGNSVWRFSFSILYLLFLFPSPVLIVKIHFAIHLSPGLQGRKERIFRNGKKPACDTKFGKASFSCLLVV